MLLLAFLELWIPDWRTFKVFCVFAFNKPLSTDALCGQNLIATVAADLARIDAN